MRTLSRDDVYTRVFGMKRPGHEGRIQALEKAPGTGEVSFAYVSIANVTIGSGSSVQTAMDFPSNRFVTNDDASFAYGLDSFSRGVHTIRFLTGGSFKLYITAQYPSIAAGRKPVVFYDPPLLESGFQFGDPQIQTISGVQNQASFWEFQYGDNATDGFAFPRGGAVYVTNDAAGTFQAYVSLYIERLSSTRYTFT